LSAAADDCEAQNAPSIRARLMRALAGWSLACGLAVGASVWLTATNEVNELLDDALQSSAELIGALVTDLPDNNGHAIATSVRLPASERFAWQVARSDGSLLARSARAPESPWYPSARPGLGRRGDWHLFGIPLGDDGRMLYVAQTVAERREALGEVALGAVLSALAVGLLSLLWMGSRLRAELRPLSALSERLERWNLEPDQAASALGMPERRELRPVHRALQALAERLSERIANERAVAAHAAHALRTPLAGIDAQLAVALLESPAPLRERLQGVRAAAVRLQGVVAALLGLFRSGLEVRRVEVDVGAMLARLSAPGLDVSVEPNEPVLADADLLAGALVNLLDNARRHGASRVRIEVRAGLLRIRDDGPGVDSARRLALNQALERQAYDGVTGLGLMMANRVARAHGGTLKLRKSAEGFELELALAPARA
jgi:signal transduction histidine kinase